jgi:P27 family predicted phage terminase small subunit
MKGRKAEPIDTKQAKGLARVGRVPDKVPPRVAGDVQMPDTLSPDAHRYWRDYCRVLAARGQLSVDSIPALVELCEVEAELRALHDDVRVNGRFQRVKTKVGTEEDGDAAYMERARPAYRAIGDAQRRKVALLNEFGLTDASRSKVNTSGTPDDTTDPAAEFGIN